MRTLERSTPSMREGFPRYTVGYAKDIMLQKFRASNTIAPSIKSKVEKEFLTKFGNVLNPPVDRFSLLFTKASHRKLEKKLRNSYARVFEGLVKTDAPLKDYKLLERLDTKAGHIFYHMALQIKKRPFQNTQELEVFVKNKLKRLYPVFSPNPRKSVEFLEMAARDVMDVIMKDAAKRRAVFRQPIRKTNVSNFDLKSVNLLIQDLGASLSREGLKDAVALGNTKEIQAKTFLLKQAYDLRDRMLVHGHGDNGRNYIEMAKEANDKIRELSVFLSAAKGKGISIASGVESIMDNSLLRYHTGRTLAGSPGGIITYLAGQRYRGALDLGGADFFKTTFMERFKRLREGINPSITFGISKDAYPRNFVGDSIDFAKSISYKINERQSTFNKIRYSLKNKAYRQADKIKAQYDRAIRKKRKTWGEGGYPWEDELVRHGLRAGSIKDREAAERNRERVKYEREFYPELYE